MGNRETDYTPIDAEEIIASEIMPLVKQIKDICTNNKIPFFMTMVKKNDDTCTKYANEGVMTGSRNIHLKEDRIKHHMMVAGGCVAAPTHNDCEIDMSALLGAEAVPEWEEIRMKEHPELEEAFMKALSS